MQPDIAALSQEVEREALTLRQVETELRKVIVGQDYLLDRLLVGLLARGHVLDRGRAGTGQDPGGEDPRRRPWTSTSSASSSRPTCCRPTSSAR